MLVRTLGLCLACSSSVELSWWDIGLGHNSSLFLALVAVAIKIKRSDCLCNDGATESFTIETVLVRSCCELASYVILVAALSLILLLCNLLLLLVLCLNRLCAVLLVLCLLDNEICVTCVSAVLLIFSVETPRVTWLPRSFVVSYFLDILCLGLNLLVLLLLLVLRLLLVAVEVLVVGTLLVLL